MNQITGPNIPHNKPSTDKLGLKLGPGLCSGRVATVSDLARTGVADQPAITRASPPTDRRH